MMRIGILVDPSGPETCGAYSFKAEVLQSLRDYPSDKEFVLLGRWSPEVRKALDSRKFVFVDLQPGFLRDLELKRRKIAYCLKHWTRPSPFFKFTTQARMLAKEHQVSLVWYLSPNYGPFELPFVCTVWDLQHRLQPCFPEVGEDSQWEERERIYNSLLPRASAIITGTPRGKEEVVHFYGVSPERVRILPFPAPAPTEVTEAEGLEMLSRYGLKPGYLYYPATFWPHKNHAGLVDTLHVLKTRYGLAPDLVLIGLDSSVRQHVEQLAAKRGVLEQIRYLGFISTRDRNALYRYALALTMVTFFGPDNLPPLEAFANECPVIASSVPGAEQQLGEAALYVDPRNPDDMAAAIWKLHEDEKTRAELIRRGREKAAAWTGKDYVRGMLEIIEEFEPILKCWQL